MKEEIVYFCDLCDAEFRTKPTRDEIYRHVTDDEYHREEIMQMLLSARAYSFQNLVIAQGDGIIRSFAPDGMGGYEEV